MKILFIFLSLLILTGCKDERLDIKAKQDFIASDKYSENISMESSIINNNLLLFITNNNKETIDIDIKVEFYDKKDKVISTEEDVYSAILDKKELVVTFEIYKKYEYFKVYIEADKSSFISYEDKISIIENNDIENYQIEFNVRNNAQEIIEYIEFTIIYYKKNKIVGVESSYLTNLKSNGNIKVKFSYPYDSNYKLIEYDNYKLFINEACTYQDSDK